MSLLRIAVFGSPEAFHGETRLIFSLKKAFALLLYLAVERGMHSRAKLAPFLWPDSDPHDARTALRNAIALLRNLLAEHDSSSIQQVHLLSEHDLLGLSAHASLDLDLDSVLQAWKQAQELPVSLSKEQRALIMADWQRALSQVRGPFLEGFWLREESPFNEWLQSQQHQWQVRLQLLFDRLSSWQEADGEHEQAIATLIRWQAIDPLQEEVYRRLMRLHLTMGNPNAALQVYVACQTRLAEELQVQPSSETTALAEHIRAVTTTPYVHSVIETDILSHEPFVPLVGRIEDFNQLVSSYQQAKHGQPRATFLIGEAGIGKTRLATDFVAWARAQGADVLSGQAFAMGGRIPYQLLVEALRQRLDEENAPDDLLDDLWLAELARILPELRVRYPDLPVSTEDELTANVRLFEAVARFLDALSQRAPLVLLLDDLHWADGPSLDLVRYLAHYWKGHRMPALLLGTIRSEDLELNGLLVRQLQDLGRDLPVTQVILQALSQPETVGFIQNMIRQSEYEEHDENWKLAADRQVSTQLVALPPSKPGRSVTLLGQSLFALTGGHPFYLVETLKILRDKGLLTPSLDFDGNWRFELVSTQAQEYSWHELLPPSVRAMILARQAMLSSNARQILMACAVLGEQATAQHLWGVTELGVQAGIDALEEAVSSGILHEEETRSNRTVTYRFTHNLIREVIYTEIGEARRHIMHQRALLLLQPEEVTAAELAYHALAAGEEREAYRYSVQAGDDAAFVFAFEDAITHYEQARSLIRQQAEHTMLKLSQKGSLLSINPDIEQGQTVNQATFPEVEHLYVYLGRIYSFLNEKEKAWNVYEDLLTHAHHMHLPALISMTLNRMAILEVQQSNDQAKVQALLSEALRMAQISQNRKAIAETKWNQAQIEIVWGDAKQAFLYGQQALELAQSSKDTELEARSLCLLGMIYLSRGDLQQVVQSTRASLALYATLNKEQVLSKELSLSLFIIGAPTSQYLTNCAAEAFCLGLLAMAQIHSGQLHKGIHSARMALLLSKEIKNSWVQISSTICLIHGLLEAGVYEEAFSLARQITELAQNIPLKLLLQSTLAVLASTYQALHQWEEARHILANENLTLQTLESGQFSAPTLSFLCMNHALSGEWGQAYRLALMSSNIYKEHNVLPVFNLYVHHEIEAFLRTGKENRAREEVQNLDKHRGPYARQHILYLRSLAVLARWDKQREQAIEHLQAAFRIAEALALPGEQWQLQAALGTCYEENKQPEQALAAFAKAALIIRRLAENIQQADLRARFLAQAEIQRFTRDLLTSRG